MVVCTYCAEKSPSLRTLSSELWTGFPGSAVATVLGVVTVLWQDWIEIVFGTDPEHGSGSLEIAVVLACFAVAVVSGWSAWSAAHRLGTADASR